MRRMGLPPLRFAIAVSGEFAYRRTSYPPAASLQMFDRYSFVALTSTDLAAARRFWAELLGCAVTEERSGEYFIVDAGGLRLCVDLADGKAHIAGSTDPTIGLKVRSVGETLLALARRGLTEAPAIVTTAKGSHAIVHDPDGRAVVLTDAD